MGGKFNLICIIFFVVLIAFIGLVFASEYRNINMLRADYPNLSEEVYNYRVDALKAWGIRLFLNFFIPFLFLVSRLSYRIRFFVENERSLFLTGLLYGLIFFSLMFLINLPLNYYSSYYLSHKYGLSNQNFGRWLEIAIKSFLINDLILSLFVFIPFYLIYRSPKIWWLQMSLLSIPVTIFIVFISPFIIDPIFNKYIPMEDGKLKEGIVELLHEADIEEAKIYKVDKSKGTKTMNAYMTGIFHSKRIVLWDTTIDNLSEREVLSIIAHEIGHFVKGHIWKSILYGIGGTTLLLLLIHITTKTLLDLSNGSFGVKKLHDIAALPLFIFVLNLYMFLGLPAVNYTSRQMEIEADGYEIFLTKDRESAITAMEKLYEESLGLPRPSNIYKIWYHTHPTLEERIEFYSKHPMD